MTMTPIIGNTPLNDAGSMGARANGAITIYRVVAFSTVSNNRPRVKPCAVAQNATLSSIDRPCGVAKATVADGDEIEFYAQPGMRVIVQAGAAIAADKDLMVTTDGKVIEATAIAGQYTQIVGRSLQAADADGDLLGMTFLPSIVGSGISAGDDLAVTDDLTVGDDATITGDLVAGTITTAGDLAAAGGFRHVPAVFRRDNVAATLTDSQLALAVHGASLNGWVAPRAGSITGLTIHSTVAAAGGAGDKLTATVFKNGVAIAAAKVELDADTGETADAATFAKDTHTFAAEDVLDIRITTPGTWSAVTADIAVFLEVED